MESVAAQGDAGARVKTHSGVKVDLRVVEPDQFGNVLQHFTGSKAHNVQLREAAVRRGLHVSEYGILDDETGETLRCATEEEVYERLGYAWIPPELREGRGELEAARNGSLPKLIELSDLRGDLHCHTTLSDGRQTLDQMAEEALKRGWEYLAVTDHSASHGFGDHVTPEMLEARIEEVAALNDRLEGKIRILAGTESNILPDGSLDYPDELLARLDWVIGSVHTSFGMEEAAMTERMIAAVEHPLLDAIGHPTGRKIETRPPYAIDMTRVIAAAAANGTMIEINAAPDRRDMNESHARAAAEAGVMVLIDSDAHAARNFDLLQYGIATARRAWLTPAQVANTRSWEDFAPCVNAQSAALRGWRCQPSRASSARCAVRRRCGPTVTGWRGDRFSKPHPARPFSTRTRGEWRVGGGVVLVTPQVTSAIPLCGNDRTAVSCSPRTERARGASDGPLAHHSPPSSLLFSRAAG